MDKTSFVSRMKEKDQKAQLKMIEMRSKQLQSELYGLQSKPAINHHSKKIVRLMGDKYRGYQDGGRKDQQDTAPEELQCSFEPKINSRSKEKKRGVEELMRWNERKQKKVRLYISFADRAGGAAKKKTGGYGGDGDQTVDEFYQSER